MLKVVAGVLIDEDKFLIGQRKSDNESYPNLWELPGGKIEPNETPDEAIKREWKEELDIEVIPYYFIPEREIKNMMVYPYLLKYGSGKAKMNDHQSVKFVTFSEIKDYKLTPISREVIHIVKGSYYIFLNKTKE